MDMGALATPITYGTAGLCGGEGVRGRWSSSAGYKKRLGWPGSCSSWLTLVPSPPLAPPEEGGLSHATPGPKRPEPNGGDAGEVDVSPSPPRPPSPASPVRFCPRRGGGRGA